MQQSFLPINIEAARERDWYYVDFIIVSGDAYVDHPSFASALLGRVLESHGYKVGIIAQPDINNLDDFKVLGKPRLGFLVSAGNVDSMVAHYTAAKKPRSTDAYSAGGKRKRPDRATIVYSKLLREIYPDAPIIIGSIEASLRRFAHYDYWDDKVRPSILIESGADILVYGMGERPLIEIAKRMARGDKIHEIRDVRGTVVLCDESQMPRAEEFESGSVLLSPSFKEVASDKVEYAKATALQYTEQCHIKGKPIYQRHDNGIILQNPPQRPLSTPEMDEVYDLPFTRRWHPIYDSMGGVPAIQEVEFSITHNRGCFGECAFCALTFHQGRVISVRSEESILKEAEIIAASPNFKGYIHDIGGPTANFRRPACKKQMKAGACRNRRCLSPIPCPNLEVDHSEYIQILDKVSKIKGVKKVFVRSGIRFDYVMLDKSDEFLRRLIKDHISGQLKVAPEHMSEKVLYTMGKPSFKVYKKFYDKFYAINKQYGLKQFLVPYLMSSHPNCGLNNAVDLALYLKDINYRPEQVQDFYPTPGSISTAMFYTELNPFTLKPVYVAKSAEDKAMQRALLQYTNPVNTSLVRRALTKCGREDLIPVLSSRGKKKM